MRIPRTLASLAGLAVVVLLLAAPPAGADDAVEFDLRIAGASASDAGPSDPLRLPAEPVLVELDARNLGDETIELRTVRIGGSVLGFPFFSFSTRIDLTLAPGASGERRFELDLFELDGQAAGLMQGRVEMLDADNRVVASDGFVVDARGSATSTYTLFGVGLALLTALVVFACIRGTRAGTLPANRWSRCVRFGEAGLGLGLTIVFTLSALRLVVLPTPVAGAVVGLLLAAGIAFGYAATGAPAAPSRDDDLVIDVRGAASSETLTTAATHT